MTAFSRSRRLNVLGFLSRRGKPVYQSTTESVTTERVIAAFDHFLAQKEPDAFTVVVLDNASMHRSIAFQRKCLEWLDQRVHVIYLSAYSPELNLIEILRRQVKYAWLPLTACESFATLRSASREDPVGLWKRTRSFFCIGTYSSVAIGGLTSKELLPTKR